MTCGAIQITGDHQGDGKRYGDGLTFMMSCHAQDKEGDGQNEEKPGGLLEHSPNFTHPFAAWCRRGSSDAHARRRAG